MQDGGTAIANAAANVRMLLTAQAARIRSLSAETLGTSGDGHVVAPDGRRLGYGSLASAILLHVEAVANAPRRNPAHYKSIGHSLPRVDIPAKLTSGAVYVQDMRLPGMVHARVVRGPSYGTKLTAPQLAAAARMPGVIKLLRNGDFLAAVARKEWQAIEAMRVAQASNYIRTGPILPVAEGTRRLQSLPSREIVVLSTHDGARPTTKTVRAQYSRPW